MKLALVLPGGGACGRWQAGVISYLQELGLKFDLVCGTSVGGLNTLAVAKGGNVSELWAQIKSDKDVYEGMLQFNSFFDFLGMAGQIFNSNKGKSILKPTGLYKLLDREFGGLVMSDLKVPVKITATDLNAGERYVFDSMLTPSMNCGIIAKATSAIPLAFPAVDFTPALFVDGGLGRNNPVEVAVKAGATHIILIGTSPDVYPAKTVKNNVLDIALRMQDIIMHVFEEEAWDSMDKHNGPVKFLDLYPKESTGSALKFNNVEQFDKGKNFALMNLSPEKMSEFLK